MLNSIKILTPSISAKSCEKCRDKLAMMTFVKLFRNPELSEIQVHSENKFSPWPSLSASPVLLYNFTHVFAALFGFSSFSGLVRVLVFVVVLGLRGVIVHVYRPFLVMVYRVSWSCLCSCLRKSACEGLYGPCAVRQCNFVYHVKRLTGLLCGLVARSGLKSCRCYKLFRASKIVCKGAMRLSAGLCWAWQGNFLIKGLQALRAAYSRACRGSVNG